MNENIKIEAKLIRKSLDNISRNRTSITDSLNDIRKKLNDVFFNDDLNNNKNRHIDIINQGELNIDILNQGELHKEIVISKLLYEELKIKEELICHVQKVLDELCYDVITEAYKELRRLKKEAKEQINNIRCKDSQ